MFFSFFSISKYIDSSDILYFLDISFIYISLSALLLILTSNSNTSAINFTLSEIFSKSYFLEIFSNLNSNNDILFFTCFKKLSFPNFIIYSSGSFAPSYFTTLTSAPSLFKISSPLIVASSPAASLSYAIFTFFVYLSISLACFSVSAVPIDATTFLISL